MNDSLRLWPGYSVVERAALRTWMAWMLVAPKALVQATASSNVSGTLRSRFRRLREEVVG